jgi:isoleucyl-tRNA synthetase
LIQEVNDAYEHYNFRRVREALFLFANDTMSAIYMSASKDRLYCERADSPKRRRTQTVMFDIASAMIRLCAPILVHTADEAWLSLHKQDKETQESVHLHRLPDVLPVDEALRADWEVIFAEREGILKALEDAKADGISYSLDAGIELALPAERYAQLLPYLDELADVCNVSRFALATAEERKIVVLDLRESPRCARSWKRDATVKQRSNGDFLSDRDAEAFGLA